MDVAELKSTAVVTGEMLIGARAVRGTEGTLRAVNPATGLELEPPFGSGSAADVNAACTLAEVAFDAYRAVSLERRAKFLETIAQGILDLGDVLVDRVISESGLPRGRVEGERARTVGQLRLFASLAREGRWLSATLDRALPDRKPLPRADLRAQRIPVGPVAVFSASNFPLAFSVAGGDTAAAFAAGCPVVAKSHSSHLGTSELVGRVVQKAVADCGLPEGVFSLLVGGGSSVGEELVKHPAICAVGFTGSRRVGRTLVALAAAREVPIPVYAEMSSINPVFLLPVALAQRAEAIAQGLIDSMTMGTGQFCTKPGIVIGIAGPELRSFHEAAQTARRGQVRNHHAHARHSSRILSRARSSLGTRQRRAVAVCVAAQRYRPAPMRPPGSLRTTAKHFLASAAACWMRSSDRQRCWSERVDQARCVTVAKHFNGQLTATLHLAASRSPNSRATLLPVLERRAGRIVDQRLPYRRGSLLCDGARWAVARDLGHPRHLRRRHVDRALAAPGLLPGLSRRLVTGIVTGWRIRFSYGA